MNLFPENRLNPFYSTTGLCNLVINNFSKTQNTPATLIWSLSF